MFVDRHDSFKDDDKYSASNVVGIHPRDWNLIKSTTNLFSKAGVIKPASWSKIVDIQETGKLIHTSIKITTGKNKSRLTGSIDQLKVNLKIYYISILLASSFSERIFP